MSDTPSNPDPIDRTAAEPAATASGPDGEPAATASGPADEPATGAPRPARARWWNRRTPLLVTGAALLLGCVLGAGVVGVAAVAFGEGGHGDDRGHSSRDERGNGRGHDGDRGEGRRPDRGDNPDQPAPAPSDSSAPSASTPPSPAAS